MNRLHSGFAEYKQTQADDAITQLLEICPTCLTFFVDFEDSSNYKFVNVDRIESIAHLIEIEQQKVEQVLIDAQLDVSYPVEIIRDDRPISVILAEERYMQKFLADERAYLKQVLARK